MCCSQFDMHTPEDLLKMRLIIRKVRDTSNYTRVHLFYWIIDEKVSVCCSLFMLFGAKIGNIETKCQSITWARITFQPNRKITDHFSKVLL